MHEQRSIAIVDDHTDFRKGLCRLIDLFPDYFVILDAVDGKDFIRQLKPSRLPDILLLDIIMPATDGAMLAAWVRSHYPGIRILALTTMESEEGIIAMIRAGAQGCLQKDAEPEEIKYALGELLQYGYYYRGQPSPDGSRIEHPSALDSGISRDSLTERELAFVLLACTDKSYYEIASAMEVSVRTVEGYRDSLFRKLKISSRVGLVLLAVRTGLIST